MLDAPGALLVIGQRVVRHMSAQLSHPYMTTIATDLLQRHIETLVDDAACWETLIADDILWELAYAPSVGHPAATARRGRAPRYVVSRRG